MSPEHILDLLQLSNYEVKLTLEQHGFLLVTTGKLYRQMLPCLINTGKVLQVKLTNLLGKVPIAVVSGMPVIPHVDI